MGVTIPETEYLNLYDPNYVNKSIIRKSIASYLYQYFRDEFDFIFLVGNNDTVPSGLYYGLHSSVRNNIQGIGKSIFDSSSLYGSAGKLRGVVDLPYLNAIDNGPSLHELAHGWANYAVTTSYSGHWGFSSGGGQLGGFKRETLVDLGDGIYQANNGRMGATYFGENANGGNSLPYSKIELYLMGLIDSSEVPLLQVANAPTWIDYGTGKFQANGFTDYTIDNIIQQNGSRIPSYLTSQKKFNILVAIVTSDTILDQNWKTVNQNAAAFSFPGSDSDSSYNFWEATEGLATVSMDRLPHNLIDYSNDLKGCVLALQFLVGLQPVHGKYKVRDINKDGLVGLPEALSALQVVAGLRSFGPVYPQIELNNGEQLSVNPDVNVTISAFDPEGVTRFYLSTSSDTPLIENPGWQIISPSIPSFSGQTLFTLVPDDNPQTVYAWFQDAAGNLSDSASDDITLVGNNGIFSIGLTPQSPANLQTSEKVYIDFDYAVTDPDGAYIKVYPYTAGHYTSGGYYMVSPLMFGAGNTTRYFYVVNPGSTDQLRFIIETLDGTVVHDEFYPVQYTFESAMSRKMFTPPERMTLDSEVLPVGE